MNNDILNCKKHNLLSFIELDKNKALASIKENLLTLEEVIEDESFTETVKEEFSYLKEYLTF